MTCTNYQSCLAITLDYEGGYSNDPGDPGGPTKFGITIFDVRKYLKPDATAADVKALTLAQAKTIYRKHYWEPVAGDIWPEGLDLSVFDAAVNSGTGRADKWAQYAMDTTISGYTALANFSRSLTDKVPAIKRYNAKRLGFLQGLRTWGAFGRGWGRRVAGIESLSVKMALTAAGAAPQVVKDKLKQEAGAAKTDSNGNATGGAGTVAGGGGGASQLDWSQADILTYVLIGVGVVAGLILLAYFIHWTIQHRNRAAAYMAAAEGVAT